MAVKWFKAGEIEKVFDYCSWNIQATHRLWEAGKMHGFESYFDAYGNIRKIKVSW